MQTIRHVKPFSSCSPCRRSLARPGSRAVRTHAIKLYTNPGSRGKITEWYLGELGVEHELVLLDMRKGDHKTPAFLAINPFGKVPAMTDGDLPLFESGAILLHLANKYGKLQPDAFGTAAQWTLFANSTLSDAFFNASQRSTQMPIMLRTLNGILATKPFLAGDEFSVSDIAVGSYLLYLPLFFPDLDLTQYGAVWSYMQKISERPACPEPYKDAMAGALEAAAQRQGGAGAGGVMSKLFGKR
ncbi:Protein gstA [Tetrabaena socialis]|uniref:Protein gstA n=1 Tax=Tetrabaena socialis TaxID=47790 RepID=A0A2J8A795_9CHLO|nr:Protein gstA [Tetrabaena socialis]|eukprot:PNH08375.1 Protein gstA [Tetrabaena socialis]